MKIVKANEECARPWNFYITFDVEEPTGDIKTYETKVLIGLPGEEMEFEVFRPKQEGKQGNPRKKLLSEVVCLVGGLG